MRHVKLEEKFNSIQNLKSKLKTVFCLFCFLKETLCTKNRRNNLRTYCQSLIKTNDDRGKFLCYKIDHIYVLFFNPYYNIGLYVLLLTIGY